MTKADIALLTQPNVVSGRRPMAASLRGSETRSTCRIIMTLHDARVGADGAEAHGGQPARDRNNNGMPDSDDAA